MVMMLDRQKKPQPRPVTTCQLYKYLFPRRVLLDYRYLTLSGRTDACRLGRTRSRQPSSLVVTGPGKPR